MACGVTGPFRQALGQIILGCFLEATVNALKKIPNSAQTIPQQFGPFGPTLAKLDPEFGPLLAYCECPY